MDSGWIFPRSFTKRLQFVLLSVKKFLLPFIFIITCKINEVIGVVDQCQKVILNSAVIFIISALRLSSHSYECSSCFTRSSKFLIVRPSSRIVNIFTERILFFSCLPNQVWEIFPIRLDCSFLSAMAYYQ